MIIKGYAVFCDDCEIEFNTMCRDAANGEAKYHYESTVNHHPFVTEINFHMENVYADRVSMTRLRIASKMVDKD